MKKTKDILFGLMIIILVSLFVLDRAGAVSIPFNFLNICGIIIGVGGLTDLLRRKFGSAFFWFAVSYILLRNLLPVNLQFELHIVILIAIALAIAFDMIFKRRKIITIHKSDYSRNEHVFEDDNNISSVFGSKIKYNYNDVFASAKVEAIFSKIQYYIDKNEIASNAIIDLEGVFSEITIYVPKSTEVLIDSSNIFSSINEINKSNYYDKTLTIKGELVFSKLNLIYV